MLYAALNPEKSTIKPKITVKDWWSHCEWGTNNDSHFSSGNLVVLLRPFCRQPHLSPLPLWLAKWVPHKICFRAQCLLKASTSLWAFQLPASDNKSHWLLKSTLHRHSQWLSSIASSNYHNKGCLSARFSLQNKYLFLRHPLHLKKASRSSLI